MATNDDNLEADEEGEKQAANGKLMLVAFALAVLATAILFILADDATQSFKDGFKAPAANTETSGQETAEK